MNFNPLKSSIFAISSRPSVKLWLPALLASISLVCASPQALADDGRDGLSKLSAQWWQWALSIPASINPVSDATGANCFVGQRGSIWFLAGSNTGLPTLRTCTVPEGTPLFFPVVNSVWVDTPICGDPPTTVAAMRAAVAAFVDGATGLSVLLDNRPIKSRRVRSEVFASWFPQDNLFGLACLGHGQIYSPSVDDGYYVMLDGLRQGIHHLGIRGSSGGFAVDVFYTLNVVKTSTGERD